MVAEGESAEESVTRKLSDFLNGIVLLAHAGLGNLRPQQISPAARASYSALLKSAEISSIDRGETKSVRLIFDVTPDLLRIATPTPPQTPEASLPARR